MIQTQTITAMAMTRRLTVTICPRHGSMVKWHGICSTARREKWASSIRTQRRINECRQIQCNVREWRPNTQLHRMFQQIGRERHGDVLKERWDDDKYGQGLVARWDFEELTREERPL